MDAQKTLFSNSSDPNSHGEDNVKYIYMYAYTLDAFKSGGK